VRHLLQRMVIVDPRPEWVAWAGDQLGTHLGSSALASEPLGNFPAELDPGPAEELPAGEETPILRLEIPTLTELEP
ncbi:MAG: hypothetical protein WD851_08950, partial [Pirellulales bacterium]